MNSQLVQVLAGGQSLAIDSFVLPGSNASYVYPTPGVTLTVVVLNGSANEADFTWTLVGRTGWTIRLEAGDDLPAVAE